MEKNNSYSHILKYTGLFGGVQGLIMLLGLVRNKLVALMLGPQGVGVVAIFSSASRLMCDTTSLGIPVSAVREISKAHEHGDPKAVERVICVFRSWCVLTAVAGTLLCAVLAPLLSRWAFSFGNHAMHFVFLSPAVGFSIVTACETAVLKATRRLRSLALLSVLTVVAALVLSLPVYYFFNLSGVVPVLVLVAAAQVVITVGFSYKLYPLRLSARAAMFREGFGFVRVGMAFVVGGVMGSMAEFVIRSYLNNVGQSDMLGLYNAAYMLVVSYAGVVFTAMETDFFPRLSAVEGPGRQLNDLVNRQIEVTLLLVSPLLTVFILAMPLLLPLLYSGKFMPVLPMIQVAALAMLARAMFLPVEYISLSRADSVTFLALELASAVMLVGFVVAGYEAAGLFGTGVAMTLSAFCELVVACVCCRLRYGYRLSLRTLAVIGTHSALVFIAYGVTLVGSTLVYCAAGLVAAGMSTAFSLLMLHRHTNVISEIRRRLAR